MSDKFLATVASNICRYRLLEESDRPVVVALSGGADSVALLHALASLGYRCIAAHCNYHLRGEESNRDERHAIGTCHKLGIECLINHFDVPAYREINKGTSLEMACRDLRYRWFGLLLEEFDAQAVAVGHNADDNIETMLHNIFRGTGITGAKGMEYRNGCNIIRPMLNITRQDIENYLLQNGLDFITDSSNLTCDFNRNRIRNIIRPAIDEAFPGALSGMTSTLEMMRENDAFYRQTIEEKRLVYMSDNCIDLHNLIKNEPLCALLIYEWFRKNGLSRTQADNIISSASTSGAQFLAGGKIWTVNRGHLTVTDLSEQCPDDFDVCFEITRISSSEIDYSNPYIVFFDETVTDGEPLTSRTWKIGDRMKPFGMKTTKKVSDIFSDAKVSVIDKKRIPLLMKGNDILWIPGLRRSDLYSVTPDAKKCISIRYTGRRPDIRIPSTPLNFNA